MIEVYCLELIDLPEKIKSNINSNEDVLLIDYNKVTNLVELVMSGQVSDDGFGGEFIINKRKLELDYPFIPTDELEIICNQSI